MGAVYRALDEKLDEEVALKMVHGTFAGVSLRDEVRLAQKVTHRNVCRTYDLEDIDGRQFVKMEYIAGETLAARIHRDGALPIDTAIRIARAVAVGLAAAHAEGIVHRDLKPGNVMLSGDRVVLTDFGLARSTASSSSDMSGTPGYMAPEQFANAVLDPRADLYALGCLAFEMVSGKRVFGTGTRAELAARHQATPPPDVRTLRPETPRWLARAITRLLAKSPGDRAAGARLLERGPRRWRILVPFVAGAAIIAALVVVAIERAPEPAAESWQADDKKMLPSFDENTNGPAISPDGKLIAYASDRGQALSPFRLFIAPISGGDPRPVAMPGITHDMIGRAFSGPRWARDGKALLVAIGNGSGVVLRQSLDGSSPVRLGSGSEVEDCGAVLVIVERDFNGFRLVVQASDGTRRELVRASPGERIAQPRCDLSGHHVSFTRNPAGSEDGNLFVTDLAGRVTQLTTDNTVAAATITPDGTSIVFSARRDTKIRLYEIAMTGGPWHPLTKGDGPDLDPDISPDGSVIVFNRDTTSQSLLRGDGKTIDKVTSRQETLTRVMPDLDGSVVLAERIEDARHEVIVITVAGGVERTVARGSLPFWSLDQRRIFFQDPEHPEQLRAIGIDGHGASLVATLPGTILDGRDGPDGQHVQIDRGGAPEAWRIRSDGGMVSEGVAGLVVPAPHGGWRAVQSIEHTKFRLRLIAPGFVLSNPSREIVSDSPINPWIGDTQLSYLLDGALHVIDVEAGGDVVVLAAPRRTHAVLAADRMHWFDVGNFATVTRHQLVNFADRPWRP